MCSEARATETVALAGVMGSPKVEAAAIVAVVVRLASVEAVVAAVELWAMEAEGVVEVAVRMGLEAWVVAVAAAMGSEGTCQK